MMTSPYDTVASFLEKKNILTELFVQGLKIRKWQKKGFYWFVCLFIFSISGV